MCPFILVKKRAWVNICVGLPGFEPAPAALVSDAPTLVAAPDLVCRC